MAQRLTVVAVALFVINGAVLALDAQAYGWAALLFAVAAYFGRSTRVLSRRQRVTAS